MLTDAMVCSVIVIQGPAMSLRQDIRSGALYLNEKLSIELQHDLRRGAIRYGNDFFHAKVNKSDHMHVLHITVRAFLI